MTINLVSRLGDADTFALQSEGDLPFNIPFSSVDGISGIDGAVRRHLTKRSLYPSGTSLDLLRVFATAYSGDRRFPRRLSHDGWTREFIAHIPVSDPIAWTQVGESLEQLLGFLTGDKWNLRFRDAPIEQRQIPMVGAEVVRPTAVTLFSGGLDSFVGALDLLSAHGCIALIGHHSRGDGPTSTAQKRTSSLISDAYPKERWDYHQMWLSPPRGTARGSETTTRSRSIIFIALGVLIADAFGVTELHIPENGFISLNVPLTPARSGSFSTRTTHPYLITTLNSILRALGLEISLRLPYRFKTKGEMLIECLNTELLESSLASTMSCAHPGVDRHRPGGNATVQCGYCIPCLVRRAAIYRAGLQDPTEYLTASLDISSSVVRMSDITALRIALDRYGDCPVAALDVLRSGPIPGSHNDLREYQKVFYRGLCELRTFLRNVAV